MADVSVDQADTYKCFAVNEYGKAIVTAALNVIEGELLTFITWYIKSKQIIKINYIRLTLLKFLQF